MSEEAWRAIGSRLREIRREAGLTGRELGSLLGWHSSKISKHEYARRLPSTADIRAWCAACGAPDEADDLIASLRALHGAYVEWKRLERAGFRQGNESIRSLWERTAQFRIYSGWLVPGPLQTADYIRSVLKSIVVQRAVYDDVETTVPIRLERQAVLNKPDKSFAVLVEEQTLRNRIGGSAVMAGQLGHLLAASTLRNLSLGIVPQNVDRTAMWPVEAFTMFGDSHVGVELVSSYLTVTKPDEVALYVKAFNELSALAVYGGRARRLITGAIDALDS
jgi:transcriptional regulator with XRE-family HTH domain